MSRQRITLISHVFSVLYTCPPTASALVIRLLYQGQELNKGRSSQVRTQKPSSSVLPHRPHPRPTPNSAAWSLFMRREVRSVRRLFRGTPCGEITNMITGKKWTENTLRAETACSWYVRPQTWYVWGRSHTRLVAASGCTLLAAKSNLHKRHSAFKGYVKTGARWTSSPMLQNN